MAYGTAARLLGEAGKKTRMAGRVWDHIRKYSGVSDPASALLRFGPDVFFGTLAGVNTPGDLTDKIVAGAASTVGQVAGGIGLSAATRVAPGSGMHNLIDIMGSVGGDFGGMAVGDQLLKGKDLIGGGKGQTPYERLGDQQRREIEQNILAQYGLAGYGLNDINPGLMLPSGVR